MRHRIWAQCEVSLYFSSACESGGAITQQFEVFVLQKAVDYQAQFGTSLCDDTMDTGQWWITPCQVGFINQPVGDSSTCIVYRDATCPQAP